MNKETPLQFVANVKAFIEENHQTFRSKNRIVSDFQGEEGLKKAYDGRQLLEILQNADDAGAKQVNITVDRQRGCASFSNTGQPFSSEGIGSLMIRDLSTKRGKKNFIGNKGLGFRSLLTWAKKIIVNSQGNSLEFSQMIAEREFYAAVPNPMDRTALLSKCNYPEGTVTFPFLGIPDIGAHPKDIGAWDTVIELYFPPTKIESIELQLADFKEEILIFLSHITELTLEGNGNQVYLAEKSDQTELALSGLTISLQRVTIGPRNWEVFELIDVLPGVYQDSVSEGLKHFSIKVAVTENLEDQYHKLFNFFPTQLGIRLPCLVHGTFDLDPSRNHLTNDLVNAYLFDKMTSLLSAVSIHLKDKAFGWNPYKILSPMAENSDDPKVSKFYNLIRSTRNGLSVIPCMDGNYRMPRDCVFHGQEFSEFVFANGMGSHFPLLLLPLDKDLMDDAFLKKEIKVYTHAALSKGLQASMKKVSNMGLYAKLIRILICPAFKSSEKTYYPLLLNKQRKFIPITDTAFTPVTKGKILEKPSFADLDFIHRGLYDALLDEFDCRNAKTSPARDLEHKLKDFFNVRSYEPAPVIESYLRSAKDTLAKLGPRAAKALIVEMVGCLFELRGTLIDRGNGLDNQRIDELILAGLPLISRNGKLTDNIKLIFGREYPEGDLAEHIFAGIHNSGDYLAGPEKWGLERHHPNDVSAFFKWLKVDCFSQTEKWKEKGDPWRQDPYIKYVFESQGIPNLLTSAHSSGLRIKGLEKMRTNFGNLISAEQFLVWVIKDEKIGRAFNTPAEPVEYVYGQRWNKIQGKSNYIQWQLQSLGLFNGFVIEERQTEGVNTLRVNFDEPIFRENGIGRDKIEWALVHLGAKRSFDELPVKAVFGILERLGNSDVAINFSISRKIYKLAIRNFSHGNHKEEAIRHPKVNLPAKMGSKKEFRPANEVYYSDNHTLPEKIINDLWMFNYSKRKGEKQISDFFGTRPLASLKLKILEKSLRINHRLQAEMNDFMDKARVYILALRIDSLNDRDEKIKAAGQLENMGLFIVDECSYMMEGGSTLELTENEFLSLDKSFYFKVPGRVVNFSQLEKLSTFRDCFAEVFSILFKITDLGTEFRNVLANGLDDTASIIEREHRDSLVEARLLMNLDPMELSFWKRLLEHLGLSLDTDGLPKETYHSRVQQLMGFRFPSCYGKIDFNRADTVESVELATYLLKKKNIPLKISFPEGIVGFHLGQLNHWFEHYDKHYVSHFWKSCVKKEQQKKFITITVDFRDKISILLPALSKANRYTLIENYDQMLRNEIGQSFNISQKKEKFPAEPMVNKYLTLKRRFESEWTGLSNEWLGLSYFSGHQAGLREELLRIRGTEVSSVPDGDLAEKEMVVETGNIREVKLIAPKSIKQPTGKTRRSARRVFDARRNGQNSEAGRNAEKLVRGTLVKEYGRSNVKWISGNSDEDSRDDSAGFDFKYRVDEKSPWFLLEVKSTSDSFFIISANELKVGIANASNYHLALVKGKDVQMVKDFFENNQWKRQFRVDGGYSAVPNDWLVSYELVEKI